MKDSLQPISPLIPAMPAITYTVAPTLNGNLNIQSLWLQAGTHRLSDHIASPVPAVQHVGQLNESSLQSICRIEISGQSKTKIEAFCPKRSDFIHLFISCEFIIRGMG